MSLIKPIGDQKILQKKPPRSVKYEHVQSSVDTGISMSKLLKKIAEDGVPKRDEKFGRMKNTEIAKFVYIKVQKEKPEEDEDEALYEAEISSRNSAADAVHQVNPIMVKSRLSSEITSEENTILLLDIRDIDEYKKCHIISSVCYPASTMNRSVNPFTAEMLHFKNHPVKKIVLYDNDEKTVINAANVMFERGFDNVYILNKGLIGFVEKYSELIEGEIPEEWLPKPVKKKATSTNNTSQTGNSTSRTQKSTSTTKTSITTIKKTTTTAKPWK
ncbi:hypothetical protein ABK040_006330 [Willaertia magna]